MTEKESTQVEKNGLPPEEEFLRDEREAPYKHWERVEHEMTAQDAAFHLIKPGKQLHEKISKTVFPSTDYLLRVAQCIGKLERLGLGPNCDEQYKSGVAIIETILDGLPAIEGRSRADFMQGLSRLFAPSYYELLKTGKITGDTKSRKQGGIFKAKDQKKEIEETG